MFRHCVMFRFKPGTSAETIARIESEVSKLAELPMVRAYQFGADAQLAEGNFDFALIADFDDQAGYEAYAVDAQHQAVLTNHIRPNIAERSAVQYALR